MRCDFPWSTEVRSKEVMKNLLAIAVFCLPAFGQASYSGLTKYQGGATWQSSATGGPFTYSARTDTCETGLENGCSGLALPYLGCNAWSNGTYTPINTTPACPVANGGLAPSVGGLTGAGNIVTLTGFNTQVVRLTDYAFYSASGPCGGLTGFTNNSSGNFNIWAADDSKVTVQGFGGTSCLFAFNTVTMASQSSSIGGNGNSTCASNCTTFNSLSNWIMDLSNPNLIWEVVPSTTTINQLIISACTVPAGTGYCVPGGSSATNVAPTFSNAANWVFSRTPVINFSAPPGCGGCDPLPSDFVANYSGTLAGDLTGTSITTVFGDNGQNKPIFGTGPTITAISGDGTKVSVTNNSMTGWNPTVGSPFVIAGVTTTPAYNGNWTVCGSGSGCTNPTATTFQYLSTVTGTGGVNSATASYPSATCPTPSGADPLNFAGHYGPIYAVNVTLGAGPGGVAGWRFYDVCNGLITGNWGDSSASIWPNKSTPTDGTCTSGCAADGNQPIGTSGGASLPDRFFLHDGKSLPNPIYGKVAAAVGEASTNPGSCSGDPCTDQDIEWEVKTTNIRICLALACQGHTTGGYLAGITSPQDAVHTWHNPTIPGTNLIASPVAGNWDRHSSYNNNGTLDYQPVFDYPQQVCDVKGTPGSAPTGTQGTVNGPCPAYFANFGINELIATENAVENPSGAHCLSGGTPVACVYRFGSVYNTGTNFNFNIQNTTPNVDPLGKFVIVASDWNLTLGCTNGWTGTGSELCLDPVSAGNTTTGVITGTSSDGSGHATITATNPTTFTAGMSVAISGTAESCLNSQSIFVTSTTSTTFAGNISGCSSFSNSSDAGTASWKSCGSTPLANAACPRTDLFVYGLLSAH